MKRILLISIVLIFVSQFSYSQKKIWNETETEKTERLSWWTEARFGMFIHWGSYAQAARHEWVKKRERISDEEY
ncbi:MAG: alpha-L-fucosidase, partial [Prolixibacteraceae bacterium]|nr:alpha-L-fucosidase [Prolixibacteraceae bacterium]